MSVVLFDTHAFVKRLTAVGMPEAQAEALASEQARLIDERLATKSDIEPLATKSDLRESELRLENRISESKYDIVKWVIGTVGFQSLVLIGGIVTLVKMLH